MVNTTVFCSGALVQAEQLRNGGGGLKKTFGKEARGSCDTPLYVHVNTSKDVSRPAKSRKICECSNQDGRNIVLFSGLWI